MVAKVAVPPGPAGFAQQDYADAYSVALRPTDTRSGLDLARAVLEGSPAPLRALIVAAQKGVLRFRLAPTSSPDHVLGWQVLEASDSEVLLGTGSPYLTARLHGTRPEPDRLVVATYLRYEQPVARALWLVVGPLHRVVVRYLLSRVAR